MRAMLPLLTGLAIVCVPASAWALGVEHVGNEPLVEANYADWPGIMPVVNHSSRVYHRWVNGDERLYYAGDVATVNDVLQKFSQVQLETLEVVLRPGPCETQTFDGQTIPYDWMLHLVGGIARHISRSDKGENVWSPHPVLTICIGEKIELDKLQISKSLKVTGLDELKDRYAEALGSTDQSVRGWGAGALAALDPYDPQSAARIAELLKDEKDWVRLNAAGAIAHFGEQAKAEIPNLQAALETENEQLKARVESAIEEIGNRQRPAEVYREHAQRMEEIRQFLKSRRGSD